MTESFIFTKCFRENHELFFHSKLFVIVAQQDWIRNGVLRQTFFSRNIWTIVENSLQTKEPSWNISNASIVDSPGKRYRVIRCLASPTHFLIPPKKMQNWWLESVNAQKLWSQTGLWKSHKKGSLVFWCPFFQSLFLSKGECFRVWKLRLSFVRNHFSLKSAQHTTDIFWDATPPSGSDLHGTFNF